MATNNSKITTLVLTTLFFFLTSNIFIDINLLGNNQLNENTIQSYQEYIDEMEDMDEFVNPIETEYVWSPFYLERFKQIKGGYPMANHPKDDFRSGELFMQTYDMLSNFHYDIKDKSHDTRVLGFVELLKNYQVEKIEKAFPLLEELNNIYKVSFKNTDAVDELVGELQSHPLIKWAEKIPIPKLMYVPNDVDKNQWQFDQISAYNAWDITLGSNNVTVAIIDDAVYTDHNDLKDNMLAGTDVAEGDSDPNPPSSANANNFSHGTHVAGIISAITDNNNGIAGLAGNVKMLPVKCKKDGDLGQTIPFAYEGIEYAISQNVDIINMSWSFYSFSAAMSALVNVAYSKKIFMAAAGGNDGTLSFMYPANYVNVMGVGASDKIIISLSFPTGELLWMFWLRVQIFIAQ